ncbi:predicted protein [Histoplasma mississippiense (nom. inval.)]|uniref:predicted protein n=1 Tax=Ajellomyces capsulatus (strain NAm1 / WU24) TaxID=2059318 RepID=UPI000157BB02|nr:predicted protein [Histoplasma mississippiense (nom. inval.)]EDN05697.1 predicted protein [Histoplasma mississippiense (nom. inval.)]
MVAIPLSPAYHKAKINATKAIIEDIQNVNPFPVVSIYIHKCQCAILVEGEEGQLEQQ